MLLSERQFEQMIGRLKCTPAARESLVSLLDASHPVYAERAPSVVARMRGWILRALGEVSVTDAGGEAERSRRNHCVCAMRADAAQGVFLNRSREGLRGSTPARAG